MGNKETPDLCEPDAEILRDAIRALSAEDNVEEVGRLLCHFGRKLMQADGAVFALRDGDYCRYVAEDADITLWKDVRVPLGTCYCGLTMINGEVLHVDDVVSSDFIPETISSRVNIGSLLVVPLGSETAYAAFGVYWSSKGISENVNNQYFKALMDVAGLALDRLEVRTSVSLEVVPDDEGVTPIPRRLSKGDPVLERLQQAQNLEGIGRLAGGVAHDFNNLITVISGYSDLLLSMLQPDSEMASFVDEIRKAGDRAALLTRRLLAFSRNQVLQPKLMNINAHAENLADVLQRMIGEDVELEASLDPDLWITRFDPGQFEHILVDLAVNARDAMPGGGHLLIETENVELDEEYCQQHAEVLPGPYVCISVSDSGSGIPASIRDKIFDPFFSTKERDKGTGLGLSTVYGVVKQSGGHIWVYSELGHGTTFKIYLPAVEVEKGEHLVGKITVDRRGNGECILLVEDSPGVLEYVRTVLQTEGYTVLATCSPEEALDIAGRHAGAIDMLLTDVVMPRIWGPVLAERILEIYKDIKVVFMSGYTDKAIIKQGMLDPGAAFIQKPVSPRRLLTTIREVLV